MFFHLAFSNILGVICSPSSLPHYITLPLPFPVNAVPISFIHSILQIYEDK